MARKRVISRTAFEITGKVVIANMENMSFEEKEFSFISVPELKDFEVKARLEKEFNQKNILVKESNTEEVLLVMDEEEYIKNAKVEKARKKYDNE